MKKLLLLGMLLLMSCARIASAAPPDVEPTSADQKPDDLAAKLIRKTVEESSAEDPMTEMMRAMSEIVEKLQVDFDPGEQTQAKQRDVSKKLDEAIKAAAARRRAQPQSDPKQMADKRTMPGARKQPAPRPQESKSANEGQAKSASEKGTQDETASKQENNTDRSGTRRAWGHLPQRERDEVLQGSGEESLERYRPWVDQYFRALQESNR